MHPYTADAEERENIPKHLALPAIALAIAFGYLLQTLKIPIPWYVDTPAVVGFYGIAFWLFDNFLWRMKLGSISPFSKIPDIRGTWVGKIRSSFQNTEVLVVVHIRQTWSKLSMELESDNSKSSTIMAALNIDDSSLRYEYRNEPRQYGNPPEHRGTGHLHILPDRKTVKGKYYTSEGSNNTGTIVLHFLGREIIEREAALQQAQIKTQKIQP